MCNKRIKNYQSHNLEPIINYDFIFIDLIYK